MKKEQSNVASLEPNVDSLRSNVASKDAPRPHIYAVGQKVLNYYCKSEILTIGELAGHADKNNPRYRVLEYPYLWNECELEPYIEPSNVSTNDTKDDTKESRNLSQNIANCDKSEDNKLKDNMEGKELNLGELLKGCEGEKIYLPDEGECEIVSVAENEIELSQEPNRKIILSEDSYIFTRTGFAYAYPSKESFLANPLNACKAWQGWKEARKPKRWRAEYGETYYSLRDSFTVCDQYENNDSDNDCAWNNYNYFRTEEEAKQAAEEVKECLMKFHEKNAGRDI